MLGGTLKKGLSWKNCKTMKLENFVPQPIGTKPDNPRSTASSYNFLKHQEEKKVASEFVFCFLFTTVKSYSKETKKVNNVSSIMKQWKKDPQTILGIQSLIF